MKTRKLAAKVLATVCLAAGVSGAAFADHGHSISVDPSWTWCKLMYETETTSSSGALGFKGTNDGGSCTSADVNVKFAGTVGGWGYYFDIDPSDGTSSTTGESTINQNMRGSIKLSRSLGNGLTVSVGDTGTGSRSDSWSGHGEWANHGGDSIGKGGIRLDYSKGNINASFVYGGDAPTTDNQSSSINVGADATFSGITIGGSYHSYKGGEVIASTTDQSAMMFYAKGSFGGYTVSAGYDMQTQSETSKTNHMGIHVWGTKGDFRPEFHYATNSENTEAAVSGTNYASGAMALGVKYVPAAWGGTSVTAKYVKTSVADDAAEATKVLGNGAKLSVGISTSVNVL